MRRIEYIGFEVEGESREYSLAMRGDDSVWHQFTIVIATAAFRQGLVRYQDAPDICFRLLRREAEASDDGMPRGRLEVTEDELHRYSAEVAPKRPMRRRPPPVDG